MNNNFTKLSTGYNSIGHLKGSRVGPKDHSMDESATKKFTEKFPKDKNCILFIEEKMDGSNCSVMRLNGEIRTLTRTGYSCAESNYEQHRMFDRWVMKNKEKFEQLLPLDQDRCVGEWMALAHGTIYPNLEHPYQIFDLFRTNADEYSFDIGRDFLMITNPVRFPLLLRKKLVEKVGLINVPLVYQGEKPISISDALNLVNENAEGVIYRIELKSKKFFYTSPYMIGKIVKHDKEDGKYLKLGQEIWNYKE